MTLYKSFIFTLLDLWGRGQLPSFPSPSASYDPELWSIGISLARFQMSMYCQSFVQEEVGNKFRVFLILNKLTSLITSDNCKQQVQ